MDRSTAPDTGWDPRAGQTYRYLRLITPLPAVWLLLAIVAVALAQQRFLDSISDYYGGPLRDVFVGALMASGIGMIAYKGRSKLEDYALNFAGANAFFVALVSNSFQDLLDATRALEDGRGPVASSAGFASSAELLQNLRISMATLVVVLAAFVLVDSAFMGWTRFRWNEQTPTTNALIVISWCGEIVLVVLVLSMLVGLETVVGWSIFSVIHFTAAALLIVNLSFAAASHAFPGRLRRDQVDAPPASAPVRRAFITITSLMWLGLLVGVPLILVGTPYSVLGVEVWEIILFIAFWVVATRSEWTSGPGRPAEAVAVA
jgi:hypothetical protein